MKRLIVVALLACGSRSTPESGGPAPTGVPRTPCDAAREKVEQLYRADAAGDSDRARVAEAVADNTAMVMNDCARSPETVAACIGAATTVQALEARCLAPIDDEGTEGDRLAR